MAYVSQDFKKQVQASIKPLLKKFGIRATLSVRHHSTLCLNISQGTIDFLAAQDNWARERGYTSINEYTVDRDYTGPAHEFLTAAVALLKGDDYFDYSDAMTDYFHCSHYIEINVGKYNKPYALIK